MNIWPFKRKHKEAHIINSYVVPSLDGPQIVNVWSDGSVSPGGDAA